MVTEINIQQIREKVYQNLKSHGWHNALKGFVLSDDFDKIILQLVDEANDNKRFTPPLKYAFKAFEACDFDKLRVVIIGQDPYPQLGVADGIAFSCSLTNDPQPSLKYIFKDIEKTLYPDGYVWDPNLERWADQGVLLLNTALTTTINKPGTHQNIWKTFIVYLLDYLAWNNPGLVYVFMGKKAQEYMALIPDNVHKLTCSHPASAAYNNLEEWDSGNIFKRINDICISINGNPINW